jgi:hypothetical protein
MILLVFAKAAEIYGSEVAANFNGAADPREQVKMPGTQ